MPSLPYSRCLFALALLLVCHSAAVAEDEPKVIKPDEAVAYATEKVTVEFKVMNSNMIKDRNGKDVVFLNSMKDYKDDDNFTVVMFQDAVDEFQEHDIDDPSKHFKDKKVRVTGGIELRRGKAQIILKKMEQIEIVKEAEKRKAA